MMQERSYNDSEREIHLPKIIFVSFNKSELEITLVIY